MATWKKVIVSGSSAALASLTLDTALPVAQGGTGATSAGAARTALGVDAAGTDNSTAVTIAGGGKDYVTLSGQELTISQIDLTDDVTGVLPSANLDADTAHLSGTQTFSGDKTFSGGLIAQGIKPLDASRLGVQLHNNAGNLIGKDLIAEDLISILPNVI